MRRRRQGENHKYQSKVQAEAKTSSNCHRNAKKRSDRGNTAKTTYRASNRKIQRNFEQIRQYFGLIKLSWLPNICKLAWKYFERSKNSNQETVKRVQSIKNRNWLRQEKLIFSCGCLSPKGALYHWVQWVRFCPAKSEKTKEISFVFFSVFQRKWLASVYERHKESSIIPPSEKPLLKILAARWFLLSWAFAFKKKHERSEFIVAFGGFGGLPLNKITEWEFITVVKKYPLCILALNLFCFWFFPIFLRNLLKIAPRLSLLSQKSLSKAKT